MKIKALTPLRRRRRTLWKGHTARAGKWRSSSVLPWLWILFLHTGTHHLPASGETRPDAVESQSGRIQGIVDDFRARLAINDDVLVRIAPENGRLVSVQRWPERPGTFLLSIDETFLASLDEEDLRAVVAHEMGHVWIFTTHPYLHTEVLANRKALELVPRESLKRLYEKVWLHQGAGGDLSRFLADDD